MTTWSVSVSVGHSSCLCSSLESDDCPAGGTHRAPWPSIEPWPPVFPCSGPWWRPTYGRSVVWRNSCSNSKASGMQLSPA